MILVAVLTAESAGQSNAVLSFQLRTVPLRAALDTVALRANIRIVYVDSLVDGHTVSASCSSCSWREALDRILEGSGVTWKESGNQVVLVRVPPKHRTSTISGTVTDAVSGENVPGANLLLYPDGNEPENGSPDRGCVTNKYGFYSLPNVPPGPYVIVARSVGYRPTRLAVTVPPDGQPLRLDPGLHQEDILLQEVMVENERDAAVETKPGQTSVAPTIFRKLPSLGGEVDIFRGLQLLPGVKSVSELSSGLFIRGTSSDQNLYVLDGVTVYNPSHLGGFLSTFNADAIHDIQLIRGGVPAEYGGRIGGVVDMTMREGTKEKVSGRAGISMIDSRLTVEGPVINDMSFMVSGRRVYLDLILPILLGPDDHSRYYFYDFNAKVNYRISDGDRVYASGYFGRDVFRTGPTGGGTHYTEVSWGNATANLRWTHIVSPELFMNLSMIYTTYDFLAEETDPGVLSSVYTGFLSTSSIKDIVLRGQADYFADRDHRLRGGLEMTLHRIHADTRGERFVGFDWPVQPSVSPWEATAYLQDTWTITPSTQSIIGVRASNFQSGGTGFFSVEPRVTAEHAITPDISTSISVSYTHQFLHTFQQRALLSFFPTNLVEPSSASVRPSNVLQCAIGAETGLLGGGYMLSVEAYWRRFRALHSLKDNADLSSPAGLDGQIVDGHGEAYGAEVLLYKREGSFTGWIGYTLSWTTRKFPDLNFGRTFFPRWDRRHEISTAITYTLGDSWEFGATWSFASGQPFTLPTGVYYFDDRWLYGSENAPGVHRSGDLYYGERNGTRLPAFHKLDLTFIHKYSWFGLPWELSLNLYNAYSRRNPAFWEVVNTPEPESNRAVTINQYTLFPIVPTVGLSVRF